MKKQSDFTALPLRLQSKIEIEPNSGCWIWTGNIDKDGYGSYKFTVKGKNWRVHRLVWTLLIGDPARVMHHQCGVKPCCNPSHFEGFDSFAEDNRHHRLTICESGRHILSESRRILPNGVSGGCMLCEKERRIARKDLTRERDNAYAREWREKHRKAVRENDRARYEKERGKRIASALKNG